MQLTWLAWCLAVATGHMENVKKSLWQIWRIHTGHAVGYAEKEKETTTIQQIKKQTVGYVEVSFLGPQCHLHSDSHPNPNPSLANA